MHPRVPNSQAEAASVSCICSPDFPTSCCSSCQMAEPWELSWPTLRVAISVSPIFTLLNTARSTPVYLGFPSSQFQLPETQHSSKTLHGNFQK